MKLNMAEIKVNQDLEFALINKLENDAAGMGGKDRKEVERLIEEAHTKCPEEWSEELKCELWLFIAYRAGFDFAAGYEASEWNPERSKRAE